MLFFSTRRSPSNWGRAVEFLQFIALVLLLLMVGACVEDALCVEPAMEANFAFWALIQLGGARGFDASGKKGRPPDTRMVVLGADVALRDERSQAFARPDRAIKLKGHIAQYCPGVTNELPLPADAIELRCKLGFYSSLLDGNLGRSAMGPLVRRLPKQFSSKMTHELARNLLPRYSALGNMAPRRTPFKQQKPIGAHIAAPGIGRADAVSFSDERVSADLHPHMRLCGISNGEESGSPISQWGICALILMVFAINQLGGNGPRTCARYVDKQAAVAALAKGSSTSEMGTVVVSVFRTVAACDKER